MERKPFSVGQSHNTQFNLHNRNGNGTKTHWKHNLAVLRKRNIKPTNGNGNSN